MFCRETFFDGVRQTLFDGGLDQGQVDGMEADLNYWQANYPNGNHQHLAYIMATDYWETARTMQPIPERGGKDRLNRMYGPEGDRPDKARELGNTTPGDGATYTGGKIQLTGRKNFRRQERKLGIPLESSPELILDMEVSVAVLFGGMMDGDFTGKSLSDYTAKNGELDWTNARRVVNGLDHASEIAAIARKFHAALQEAAASYGHAQAQSVLAQRMIETIQPDQPINPIIPPAEPPAVQTPWHSGWKTHTGMLISGLLGIGGMLGYIPGISPEAGAGMLQDAFAVSGLRAAAPSLIGFAIDAFLTSKQRRFPQ